MPITVTIFGATTEKRAPEGTFCLLHTNSVKEWVYTAVQITDGEMCTLERTEIPNSVKAFRKVLLELLSVEESALFLPQGDLVEFNQMVGMCIPHNEIVPDLSFLEKTISLPRELIEMLTQ